MEDLTVRRLTKKVFPYVWLRHKLMSSIPSTGIFPFSAMTVFSHAIGNAVIVYLHMYRPTLSHYLEKHIPPMPQSKMHFWTHVAFLCLQVRLTIDNIFDYFLTVCSITAEVALHCYVNGYDDVLPLASLFFCAFFENELYEGFHKTGGWVGLIQYINYTSCPELHELVNTYIKKINSPSEHLPILIMIKREQLAAGRREKLMALRLLKTGEVERDDHAKSLISGIFHWDFMENQRISEVRPGILKRMENVRHKKTKSNITMGEKSINQPFKVEDELDADNEVSNADDRICLLDEAQTLKLTTKRLETRSNCKDGQTLKDLNCVEVRHGNMNQFCTSNKTNGKSKSNSTSSLRELCDFYENLSSPPEATMDDSNCLKSRDGTSNEQKSFESEGIFSRNPKLIPHFSENGKTFIKRRIFTSKTSIKENTESLPKSSNFCADKTVIKSTESLHVDALSELTETMQELGFSCLCVGNSSQIAENPATISNCAAILEKCRYFQNKYPSIQFAILIPNDSSAAKTPLAPGTENSDEILSETQYEGQQSSSTTKNDFENCSVPHQSLCSETKKSRFFGTKVDGNQFRLSSKSELLQNFAIQSIQTSKSVDKNVEENDLISRRKASKVSKFSITKVNENQMISRNETGISYNICRTEPMTVSRFEVAKVNENQSKDQNFVLDQNWTSEKIKTSRFTVTKVNENKDRDTTAILRKTWASEPTKISRFTVTKIDENKARDITSITGKNCPHKTTKISRFTVTKVDESKDKDITTILGENWENETNKTSRFNVTKVDENKAKDITNITETNCAHETTKISRFTVTKVDENKAKEPTSRLGENYAIQTNKISRFTVMKVNETKDTTTILGENCANQTNKISRFTVTKVDENKAKDIASITGKNCAHETPKISGFTVTKVNENKAKYPTSVLEKNCANETNKISRFTVTKVNENKAKDIASITGENCAHETPKISRFTVTKVNENKAKDPTSILGENCANETNKISRFTVTKVNENESKNPISILRKKWINEPSKFTDDNQLMSRVGTSFLMRRYSTNNSGTKVDGRQSRLSEGYYFSREISDDSEDETVQFQDNGSVKYEKRVSFAEYPFISYYHPYSSDDSPNSRTSRESLSQYSPEDSRSPREFGQSGNKEDNSFPTLSKTAVGDKQYSFSDNQSSIDDKRYHNPSDTSWIERFYRRPNNKNDESLTEAMFK